MSKHCKPFGVRDGGIQVGSSGMDVASLKRSAEADPKEFAHKVRDLTSKGAGNEPALRWEHVRNVKAMQDALADVHVPVYDGGSQRAITSSAFPLLSSALTVAGVNDAYMGVPTIGQELVTEFDDVKESTTFAGILSEENNVDRVDEGKPFPLVGAGQEKFEILHKRNGRRMVVTQEMIERNDLAGIVQRVNALGEISAEIIEKQTLRRVCDIDGSGTTPAEPYVLRLNGTAAAFYQTDADPQTRLPTNGNRITSNALSDTTDLENARSRLAGMLNSRGERIVIPQSEMVMLVPDALLQTAWKLTNSNLEPSIENEANFYGPMGPARYRVLSSPKLDDLSTSVWYLGCFAKVFLRKWSLRPETVVMTGTAPGAQQSYLDARIGFQARVAWDCEIGAIDQGVWVVQNLPATTAP